MKLTNRQINDLLNMVDHTRRDISYGEGGTFGDGESCDKKTLKSVERAIKVINLIILTNI